MLTIAEDCAHAIKFRYLQFVGLTKDSLREDQITGALSGLLYAYEMIGESPKRLTHMRGEVWKLARCSMRADLNPHRRGYLVSPQETKVFFRIKPHMKIEVCG